MQNFEIVSKEIKAKILNEMLRILEWKLSRGIYSIGLCATLRLAEVNLNMSFGPIGLKDIGIERTLFSKIMILFKDHYFDYHYPLTKWGLQRRIASVKRALKNNLG